MCGIFSSLGYDIDSNAIERALDALHHRGPDGRSSYIDAQEKLILGHTRLSIIDIEAGGQPLISRDKNKVLICNGEIYDHERLRAELIADGFVFSSCSDSEVILYLYERDGIDFTQSLRGEFSFLLLDKTQRKLYVCRDRFGIKPLFYHLDQTDGFKIAFASEAKALFAAGILNPRLDLVGIRDMLSFVPMDSIFEGIKAVAPATLMTVDLAQGAVETNVYWELDLLPDATDPEVHNEASVLEGLKERLEKAVALRLRADVPVGIYLSGGLDSAAIAAIAARLSPTPLKVFSISFNEDERYDEAAIAERMATRIGADFYKIQCKEADLLNNLEDCLWFSEMPAVNYNGVGKFLLSRLAAQHVTCVLTGEGSDELFLGYAYFKNRNEGLSSHAYGRTSKKLSRAQKKSEHLITRELGFVPQVEMIDLFAPRAQRFLRNIFVKSKRAILLGGSPMARLKQRINRADTEHLDPVNKLQMFSIKGLLSPFILSNLGDRQEMAHALEGRTPFLDHHLFSWACKLPNSLKIKDGVEKYILREVVKDDITEEVYARKKWPYITPPIWVSPQRSEKMAYLIDTYLSSAAIAKSGLFSVFSIRLLLRLIRTKFIPAHVREKLNNILLYVLTVQILEKQYVQDFDIRLASSKKFSMRNNKNHHQTTPDHYAPVLVD